MGTTSKFLSIVSSVGLLECIALKWGRHTHVHSSVSPCKELSQSVSQSVQIGDMARSMDNMTFQVGIKFVRDIYILLGQYFFEVIF